MVVVRSEIRDARFLIEIARFFIDKMATKSYIDDLEGLTSDMRFRASQVIDRCAENGFALKIYCTLRTAEDQAKIFRQSRKLANIKARATAYCERGYDFLADILMGVGPQYGKLGAHLTNAGPGESWHQYGRAWDAVPIRGGKALWETEWPEWEIYGNMLAEVGLHWAGAWKRFREFPHAQDTPSPNPLQVLWIDEVKRVLEK